MGGRQIGRTQHDSLRDTVQLDQGQRGGQLVLGRDQNRAAPKILEPSAESGSACQFGESERRAGAVEHAGGELPFGAHRPPEPHRVTPLNVRRA